MPLHIDIKINEKLIRRLHIARMTSNGMNPDSINEYAVVMGEKRPVIGGGLDSKVFPVEPEFWEWDLSEIRFLHRYGDDELTCLIKAIEAVKTHDGYADNAGTHGAVSNKSLNN